MISLTDAGRPLWADNPVLLEVAMRLYAQMSAQELVRTLEDEGWEPGELHRELSRRAIAAAGTFVDSLDELRSPVARKGRRAS